MSQGDKVHYKSDITLQAHYATGPWRYKSHGHVIDHEDPESPVTTHSNSPEARSANGTDDNISLHLSIDSPTSPETTVDVIDID